MRIRFGKNLKNRSGSPGKTSTAGKMGASIFFLIFFAMGLVFVVLLLGHAYSVVESYGWPQRPVTITQSDFKTNGPDDENPYTFEVAYTYQVNGRTYRGDRYAMDFSGTDNFRDIQQAMLRFPVGAKVDAYVNPDNPSQAVLEHRTPWLAFFVVLPLVFVLIGGGGLYFTWFGKDKADQPLSQSASNLKGKGRKTGLVVCLVLVAAGLPLSYYFALKPTLRWFDAQSWPATQAHIEVSRVLSKSGDDGTTYRPDILFRYQVGGQTYRSNDHDFSFGSSSGRRGKVAVTKRYPKGSTANAYVDPNDPTDAVLEREYHWMMLLGWIPVLVALGGASGLVTLLKPTGVKARWGGGRGAGTSTRGADAWPDYLPEPKVQDISGGHGERFELRPAATRWGKLLGGIVFTAIWNGIVSIFVWQVVDSHLSGDPEWFLTLFMIPFVLVGLGAVGYVVYALLGVFNPHAILRTGAAVYSPGQTVELDWRLEGAANRISRLTFQLTGTEKATYRRGTNTHTDTHDFFDETLLTVDQVGRNSEGQLVFAIPPDAMHSFEADNNEVIWKLTVHGDIKRWPDMKDQFPLVVAPDGLTGNR